MRVDEQRDRCDTITTVFFFKQKTAYEMLRSLVGSEMCIRDSDRAARLHASASSFCTCVFVHVQKETNERARELGCHIR